MKKLDFLFKNDEKIRFFENNFILYHYNQITAKILKNDIKNKKIEKNTELFI